MQDRRDLPSRLNSCDGKFGSLMSLIILVLFLPQSFLCRKHLISKLPWIWATEEDQPTQKRLQSWKASTFVFKRIKLFHLYLNEYTIGKKPTWIIVLRMQWCQGQLRSFNSRMCTGFFFVYSTVTPRNPRLESELLELSLELSRVTQYSREDCEC